MSLKEHVRPYYLKWLYFRLFPRKRPSYFTGCWNYERAENGAPGARPDFLFLPMTDWHTRLQRSQHLALALARLGHRCFYVNPHLGREFPSPSSRHRGPVITSLAAGVREVHIHLAAEPVFHHRMLAGDETEFVARALEEAAANSPAAVQVISFPIWLEAAKRLRKCRGWPIVHDCHDLLSGFRAIDRRIVSAEEELFRASDLVLFSSRLLKDQWEAALPEIAGKSMLLRNAVDADWTFDPPPGKHSGKVAGYAGALDFWFDTQAVKTAAQRHPEWKFVLIGRVEHPGVLELKALSNVEFVGEVPHAQLRERMADFDAAMIPFQVNDLTRCADPIKLYEYFAFGLPVVSAPLPEVEPFRGAVYIAGRGQAASPDDFTTALEAAMAENSPSLRAERRGIAASHTWSSRAGELRAAVERLI